MTNADILPAWGRILSGYKPFLSIEITKECPLRCPGCYAYEPEHLGSATTLRQLNDLRGQDLIDGVMAVVRRFKPLHLSIVGGEPLVRFRELNALLPKLNSAGVEVQLITSAVGRFRENGLIYPIFTWSFQSMACNRNMTVGGRPQLTIASCKTSPATRSSCTVP